MAIYSSFESVEIDKRSGHRRDATSLRQEFDTAKKAGKVIKRYVSNISRDSAHQEYLTKAMRRMAEIRSEIERGK